MRPGGARGSHPCRASFPASAPGAMPPARGLPARLARWVRGSSCLAQRPLGGRRHEQDRLLVSLKARFLRLYPAQSDIPVSAVKKNPLKQILLTKKGGEKGAFNLY